MYILEADLGGVPNLRAINENGDLRWNVTGLPNLSAGISGFQSDSDILALDGSHNLHVLNRVGTGLRVSKFDVSGNLLWDEDILAAPAPFLLGGGIVVSGTGQITMSSGFFEFDFMTFEPIFIRVTIRLDDTGTELWRFTDPTMASGSLTSIQADEVIVAGGMSTPMTTSPQSIRVTQLDGLGQVVWSVEPPSTSSTSFADFYLVANEILVGANGDIYILWSWNSPEFLATRLVCVNSAGVELWNWTPSFVTGFGSIPAGLDLAPNGDVVVAVDRDPISGSDYDMTVCRLNAATGAEVWSTDLPGQRGYAGAEHVFVDAQNSSHVLTYDWPRSYLYQLDGSGSILGATVMENLNLGMSSAGVVFEPDDRGNLVVAGHVSTSLGGGQSDVQTFTGKYIVGGEQGVTYCSPGVANSTGASAHIRTLGRNEVQDNNLTLHLSSLLPNVFCMFLASPLPGFVPMIANSQGTLCLGGPIGRYNNPAEIRLSDENGIASLQLELTETPSPTGRISIMIGETWNFQGWHRDINPTSTSNFSDAVEVVFQ